MGEFQEFVISKDPCSTFSCSTAVYIFIIILLDLQSHGHL